VLLRLNTSDVAITDISHRDNLAHASSPSQVSRQYDAVALHLYEHVSGRILLGVEERLVDRQLGGPAMEVSFGWRRGTVSNNTCAVVIVHGAYHMPHATATNMSAKQICIGVWV
jgi:hypothetical protein